MDQHRGPALDLDDLPREVRRAVNAAMEGDEIAIVRGEREIGFLAYRSAVLDGVVLPAAGAAPSAPAETPLPAGVTVVATAMRLSKAARQRLSDEFGADYLVFDLLEAPESTNVLLTNPVSPQLLGRLRGMFPQARIIVTEIEDEELDVSYGGPVSRLLSAGASAYLPPRPISAVASDVHAYVTQTGATAIEAHDGQGRQQLPPAT